MCGVAAACVAPAPLVDLPGPGGPVSVAAPDVVGPLRPHGTDLVDATGRVVQIHGVNSVAKWSPWVTPVAPIDGFDHDTLLADDLAELDRDGFNGIRLGVWPAALMPAPGVVDEAYLDRVAGAVDALAAHGIWVLLDLHQDVFEGMPGWATTPAAAALSDEVDPGLSAAIGWAASYVSPRSLQQWDDWWSNAPVAGGLGVVDAYAQGAAHLAARFADDPAVIGLELVNEPFPGSPVLRCVLGGCPDLDATVAARNEQLTEAVRAAAPDLPVWWEQEGMFPTYADADPPTPAVTPTTDGPGVVVSFHTYCLDTDGGQPVLPSDAASTFCEGLLGQAIGRGVGLGRRWGAPAVLTEFGASQSPLNATVPARLADQHLLSWFHWHHGRYPGVVESQLVRTYAQATAGTPIAQRFDPATGDFELRYAPDRSITAPTSIVVPQRAYPDGYRVEVEGGAVTSGPDDGRLTVVPDATSPEVRVHVTRA